MLKPVNKEKNPGLAKLPEKVRNRMGFAKKGKMTYAKSGTMSTKDDDKRDIRKTESMIGASKSSKREKGKKAGQIASKAIKASMGKSVQGYGAARTSGMGLQDEQLIPGKSLDYYKDLI